MSLARILSDREEEILVRVRRALGDARLVLEKAEVEERDARFFDSSVHRLDELFLLVVVGEFNSGKSAFHQRAPRENASRRRSDADHSPNHHRASRK
jgi:hypothetical protein